MSAIAPYFVQEFQDATCTYEIRAVFGDSIRLEEVLAERVLRGSNTPEKSEETACLFAKNEL